MAVREAIRVLRPGGKLILMFCNRNSCAYRILFPIKRILQPSSWGKTSALMVNQGDAPNNPLGKLFSKKELCFMLAGVDQIQFETNLTFSHHENKLPSSLKQLIIKHFVGIYIVKDLNLFKVELF